MKILTHIRHGGLYDFDEVIETLSKVFKRTYSCDDSIEFVRHNYVYIPGDYREASSEDIKKYKQWYYTEKDNEKINQVEE